MLIEHWPFVAFVLAVFGLLLLSRSLFRDEPLPYEKRDALVTDTELEFYQVLAESAGEHWTIFAMVRIADLIKVVDETPKRLSWQNRINCKHIDFVLCDPESLVPRVAIELDDRSHQRTDRIERDRFVDDAMEAAGLPLLRVKVRSEYDPDKLRQRIENAAA